METLTQLRIDQKIGQLFCIGIAGPELDAVTVELLNEIKPGGICLFARNIRTPEQTRELLDGIRELLPVTPILSIDQEGGTVDRLRRLVTPMAPAGKIKTAEGSSRMGMLIAETLRILGLNMDFAPVVDVVDDERSKFSNGLFTRPFGRSKEDVVELAGSFLTSLQEGGIVGCLKHFPGLGGADVDSHEELPEINVSKADLESLDIFPYLSIDARIVHAVMVAHACYPNVDLQETGQNGKLLASSLSRNMVSGLLRDNLAFDGLAITDDLEMGAILRNYGIGDACEMAVNAGEDMLAICADPSNIRLGFDALRDAVQVGRLSESRLDVSLDRIAILKGKLSAPLPFDPQRLRALSDEIAAFNAELETP